MQYPTLPQLTPDGVIYHNQLMGTLEAMLPPGPWASAHAPALLETPQGDLLCAWFAGAGFVLAALFLLLRAGKEISLPLFFLYAAVSVFSVLFFPPRRAKT